MFGMADDEEPVEKNIMALSSAAITYKDSVNNNLATILVDSERQVTIRRRHHPRPQAPSVGLRAFRYSSQGSHCRGNFDGRNGGRRARRSYHRRFRQEILVRVDIVAVPGIGRNLFSAMTAVKTGIVIYSRLQQQSNRWTFTDPRAGYSERGDRYEQQ